MIVMSCNVLVIHANEAHHGTEVSVLVLVLPQDVADRSEHAIPIAVNIVHAKRAL